MLKKFLNPVSPYEKYFKEADGDENDQVSVTVAPRQNRGTDYSDDSNNVTVAPRSNRGTDYSADPEPDTTTTEPADNTQDILGINSGNEWIKIETNPATDVITVSHDVKNTTTTTAEVNLSTETDGSTQFVIPVDTYDATNHFASRVNTTYTLPNGYGKFTGDTGNSEATSSHDTFSLTGDNWIKTTATKDNIAFVHIGPVETAHVAVANETPAFGSTFTITDLTFDAKGHKANSGTHTVKIPQGSLSISENIDNAKVLTSIGFTPTTGAIAVTNKDVGTLALTGYNSLSSLSSMPVASDSINTAIGKLAYILNNDTTQVNTRITNAINGLDSDTGNGNTNEVLTKITITDGKITAQSRLQLGTAALENVNAFDAAGAAAGIQTTMEAKSYGAVGANQYTFEQMVAEINALKAKVAELEERLPAEEEGTEGGGA